MSAHTGFGPRDRWRLRQNRLWILAGVLGAATVLSFAGIIHDTAPRRVAATLVRRATTERIASYAEARLTALGLATFAPAATSLAAVVEQQTIARRCGCRDTLPASEFFALDLATGMLRRDRAGALPDTTLMRVVRREAARGAGVHLATDRALGNLAIVTYVVPDTTSRARAVLGLLASARAIGQTLFANADRATNVADGDERMARLDSMAILAFGPDSVALFGTEDPAGRYYRPTALRGPLEGSTVAIALPTSDINRSLIQLATPEQLFHNGLLLLATIVAVAFAVGSSRREIMLARARSDFVAGVSHDLRMPLAQILLAGETVVAHPDAPDRERATLGNTIVRETRRLIALVENLLLFSRTGSVELRPHMMPLRVDELFAAVTESVELAADDAGQHVDTNALPSVGVHADAQLLRQALVNLVDNALKYGPAGQHVRLTAVATSASMVHIMVDDEGPGIPAQERERVFEPYHRLDRDQTSERTGTGLGLSVVRQIVEACGGRVWLETAPNGRGTRAVIELARAEVSVVAEPVEAR